MEENGGNIVMECQSVNNNRDKGDLSRNTGKCLQREIKDLDIVAPVRLANARA